MRERMGIIFVFVFFSMALIYAFLASFTTVLYRHKAIADLSHIERNILYGRATVAERVGSFAVSIFSSLYFHPCWITAAIAMGIYWIVAQ